MNSIVVSLPASVGLADVADVLRQFFTIEDMSGAGGWSAQVNVVGDSYVFVTASDSREFDPDGRRSRVVREVFGDFDDYDFASTDLGRACEVIAPVVRAWRAIVDDGSGRLVTGDSFLTWFGRHPHATSADIFDLTDVGLGDRRTWHEMPTLVTYDVD